MPSVPRHRAGPAPAGARAAVREAGRPARPSRQAKVWHPDLAPRAPDRARAPPEGGQRGRRPARVDSPRVARRQGPRNAVKVSAAAARKRRAEEGAGRTRPSSSARARRQPTVQRNDPFGSHVPDHSVVHRYARSSPTPMGRRQRQRHLLHRRRRRRPAVGARAFQPGVRTVPAGSLQFVDFSTPDPGAERVQRFMTAAQHAMAEGDSRSPRSGSSTRATPSRATRRCCGRMTLAFWQAGDLAAAGRAVRDWTRVERRPAGAAPLRRAHLRGHGRRRPRRRGGRARGRAGAAATPTPGSASAACACGCGPRRRARGAERARRLEPTVDGLLDLALATTWRATWRRGVGAASRRRRRARVAAAWSRYAHALARTDRVSDAIAAAERALLSTRCPRLHDLLERLRAELPRVLPAPDPRTAFLTPPPGFDSSRPGAAEHPFGGARRFRRDPALPNRHRVLRPPVTSLRPRRIVPLLLRRHRPRGKPRRAGRRGRGGHRRRRRRAGPAVSRPRGPFGLDALLRPLGPGRAVWSQSGTTARIGQLDQLVDGARHTTSAGSWSSSARQPRRAAPTPTSRRATPPTSRASSAAMTARCKGRVAAWEIWNEPDASESWHGTVGAAAYAPLLKAAYRAVKDADSAALVLAGGRRATTTTSSRACTPRARATPSTPSPRTPTPPARCRARPLLPPGRPCRAVQLPRVPRDARRARGPRPG